MRKILLILIVALSSCHNLIKEDNMVVVSIKGSDLNGYNYCYEVLAFPANQFYYSNKVYLIGDTIK